MMRPLWPSTAFGTSNLPRKAGGGDHPTVDSVPELSFRTVSLGWPRPPVRVRHNGTAVEGISVHRRSVWMNLKWLRVKPEFVQSCAIRILG